MSIYQTALAHYTGKLTGLIASLPLPSVLRPFAHTLFAKSVGINLNEVEHPLNTYPTLNAFFTRGLQPNCREIPNTPDILVSPVDGTILEFGQLDGTTLLQAKGNTYDLHTLIPDKEAKEFENGSFITIYLSPKDCHRIFSPATSTITKAIHVPGALFPVREPYISHEPNLYTKNERLITLMESSIGKLALVKVAAINVGNIKTTYAPHFPPKQSEKQVSTEEIDSKTSLKPGDHLASFLLGSTIVLITQNPVKWKLTKNQSITYGTPLTE